MGKVNLGRVGFVLQGQYNSTKSYKRLDCVTHNNSTYAAMQDVPAGTSLTDVSYWQSLIDGNKFTIKTRIDFDDTKNQFKHNGNVLNFKQLHDIHLNNSGFAFIVYGDRAYLLSYVQDDPTAMRELRFQSAIVVTDSSNLSYNKTSGIYVKSSDGVNIASVQVDDVTSENTSYKATSINSTNEASNVWYPSNKAVFDYVSPINQRLAKVENALSGNKYMMEVDDSQAYVKHVPDNVKSGALIDKISGKSLVWTNYVDTTLPMGFSWDITDGNEANRTKTIYFNSGTKFINQHKYGFIFSFTNVDQGNRNYEFRVYFREKKYNSTTIDTIEPMNISIQSMKSNLAMCVYEANEDRIAANPATQSNSRLQLYMFINQSQDRLSFNINKFAIVDLTLLFGAGNEPTSVDDQRIAFIKAYYSLHPEYSNGTIISSDIVSIDSFGKNLAFFGRDLSQDSYSYSWNGTSITTYKNGRILINGTGSTGGTLMLRKDGTINPGVPSLSLCKVLFLERGIYTLSHQNVTGSVSSSSSVYAFVLKDAFTGDNYLCKLSGVNNTYNLSGGLYFLQFYIEKNIIYTNYSFYPQIERGDKVTAYEPYNMKSITIPESIYQSYPLRSVGDVYDSYEYDGVYWTYHKRIVEVDASYFVLGSSSVNSAGIGYLNIASNKRFNIKLPWTDNMLTNIKKSTSLLAGSTEQEVHYSSGNLFYRFPTTEPVTLDKGLAAFADNNVQIYYVPQIQPDPVDITEQIGDLASGNLSVSSNGAVIFSQADNTTIPIQSSIAYMVKLWGDDND